MKSAHRSISPARMISYNTLVDLINNQSNVEQTLNAVLKKFSRQLKRQDLSLAYEIIYGSLRWWDKLYWILQNYSTRNLDHSSNEVKVALLAGTYQIFYLERVPNRASINESSEYVRIKKQHSAVPFVNGILRQVAMKARYFPKPDQNTDPDKFLALQYSHPIWLVQRWLKQFKFAKLEQMLKNINKKPPITIRFNLSFGIQLNNQNMQHLLLKNRNKNPQKRPLRNCFQLIDLPDLSENSLFGRGIITIQDESSQLIAPLLNPEKNDTILDACAGPGGKLTHIYELCAQLYLTDLTNQDDLPDDHHDLSDIDYFDPSVHDDFPRIIAFEKKQFSYNRMIENLRRHHCSGVITMFSDFLHYTPSTPVNKILLDAPCSGLGVLRRHPEGKLFKKPKLIDDMIVEQRKLLEHGFNILCEGGIIVFSICSFEHQEIYSHLEWLEENYPNTHKIVDPSPYLQAFYRRYINSDKILLIYGGNSDGMDGFSAVIIKKLPKK